ncbi:PAS domain-containing protein [Rhodophyticola sp.]|jgi:PAS domain S-box-containing protein|uniref:PAS domain-containing protein n=1 Tax=Rhodophyticola sp. TaxID=2680032 RepID=UPI003D2D126D
MTFDFQDISDEDLDYVLDLISLPVFVVDIDQQSNCGFRFRGLNRAYERDVGMKSADIAGMSPTDLLPERLAETVLRNYRQCAETGAPYSYHEELTLEGETRWWSTTLSPVFDRNGRVCRLIGIARDVTELQHRHFDAAKKIARLTRLNDEVRLLAEVATTDVQGPLGTAHAMIRLAMEDFVDLGDGKLDLLSCALDVVGSLEKQLVQLAEQSMRTSASGSDLKPVDLGHICADLVAQFDPGARLLIQYPSCVLPADPVALPLILRLSVAQAVRRAIRAINIKAEEETDGTLRLQIADDRKSVPFSTNPTLAMGLDEPTDHYDDLRNMVESRGGKIESTLGGPFDGGVLTLVVPLKPPSVDAAQMH